MCFHAKTCEIMGKTVLFGVIFHQNGRVWPPGETTYVVLECCKALCLIGNAFLCISNSVFWVIDIFQRPKIAKNSYFFVFLLNLAVRPPGEKVPGLWHWCKKNIFYEFLSSHPYFFSRDFLMQLTHTLLGLKSLIWVRLIFFHQWKI